MALTTIGAKGISADLISAQTALTTGLSTTDEIIVSDAGVIKKMDISVLEIAASQITASGTLPALNGAALTALSAANITASGTLPVLDGSALTALNGTQVTSGTVPVAQLGSSGTRSSSTFLNGANAWAAAGGDFTNGGDNGALVLGTNDANSLTFETTNTPRIVITAAGLVHIGEGSSQGKFMVSYTSGSVPGAQTAFLNLRDTDAGVNGNVIGIAFSGYNAASRARAGIWAEMVGTLGSGHDLVFAAKNAADGTDLVAGDEKMRIMSGGYVGIGTSSPAAHLDVLSATGESTFKQRVSYNSSIYMGLSQSRIDVVGGNSFHLYVNGSQKIEVGTGGDLDLKNGNVIIGTAGKGIDFSASAHATSMANELLDDYEEGTWSPELNGTSGSTNGTWNGTVTGYYIKVGGVVHIDMMGYKQTLGSWGGSAFMIGLPFTAQGYSTMALGYFMSTSVDAAFRSANVSGTQINFRSGTWMDASVPYAELVTGRYISLSGTYRTAS